MVEESFPKVKVTAKYLIFTITQCMLPDFPLPFNGTEFRPKKKTVILDVIQMVGLIKTESRQISKCVDKL